MSNQAEIVLGDCREVLKTLEADSFDSMVTDPPAGIAFMSVNFDTFKGLDEFEGFLTEVFKEAYRVLKPGAHILVWSLPRTSHRTAMAIERSGFELRDALSNIKDRSLEVQTFLGSLTLEQQELLARASPTDSFISHLFGQGFPKGSNVGKAIDKMKGAKREVVGPGKKHGGGTSLVYSQDEWTKEHSGDAAPSTAPSTPEAIKWEGWNTTLKPAVETWWLARKPLKEKTVVEQVLATGTGAINVDGCRVPGGRQTKLTRSGPSVQDEVWEVKAGRWPANVTLQHGPSCRKVGTKSVTPSPSGTRTGIGYQGGEPTSQQDSRPWISEDGTETVEAWECAPSCPVKALNEQSGTLTSGMLDEASIKSENKVYGKRSIRDPKRYASDSGGASRFFNNFEPDPEAPPFYYTGKIAGGERGEDMGDGVINNHPTVKARKLMTHLVKMVTPPGGRVLDPFAGSGSALVAAIKEGFSCLGIEKEPEYHAIAQKRVESSIGANTTLGDLMSELGISED